MSDHTQNQEYMSDHDEEEEFIEDGEVDEEEVFDANDENIPMDDDEDEGFHGTKDIEGDNENMELMDDSVMGFFEHKEPVYSVDIHPSDPNIVITGGGDDKSYLWRADTGEQLFTFSGHTDSVTTVCFSVDGQFVASGGMDGKARVWKTSNGEFMTSVEGPDEIVWMNWHPKGNILLAGATDSTIWMWAMPTGKVMNVFAGHAGPVTAGRFTPDGKKVVTVSEDGSLIIWDPKTATAVHRFSSDDARFHQQGLTSVAVNSESALAITGSMDATARLTNINSGTIVARFDGHEDSVETVAFSNVQPLAATGSVDGKVNLWDLATMRLRQTLQHDDVVTKVQFHASAPYILSSSADRTVRLWDVRTGANERKWMGHQDVILDFAWFNDGSTIVTASDDGCSLVFKSV